MTVIYFLEILQDKAANIKKIAEFLGVSKYNIDDVITNTSVEKTRERRKKKIESSGQEFKEAICYRTGSTNSWEDYLSPEVLQLYACS